jgi:fructoselysine 6-kinase
VVRLLGLGDNTVDTYVDAGLQYPGGNAVNVAVLAHRLGARASYLGCLGQDRAGTLVLDALRAEGVDTARVRRRAGANARALIGHRGGDRRFLGSRPGVRAQYDLGPEDFAYAAEHDITHTSIYGELDVALPRLRQAVPRLSFDYSERWTEALLGRTLPFVDIAFLSCPGRDDAACAALLHSCIARGAAVAVATRGGSGAMALAAGCIHRQAAVPTDVADTLGAGDAFIAAFLLAHLRGDALPDCLHAGATFAADACTWPGGFGHGAAWRGEDADFAAQAAP